MFQVPPAEPNEASNGRVTPEKPGDQARISQNLRGPLQADGAAHAKAPKWAKYRTDMTSGFPLPYRGGKDPLAEQIGKFVAKLDMLRPEKGGPAYLGESGALTWTYPEVKDVKINQEMGDLDGVSTTS